MSAAIAELVNNAMARRWKNARVFTSVIGSAGASSVKAKSRAGWRAVVELRACVAVGRGSAVSTLEKVAVAVGAVEVKAIAVNGAGNSPESDVTSGEVT